MGLFYIVLFFSPVHGFGFAADVYLVISHAFAFLSYCLNFYLASFFFFFQMDDHCSSLTVQMLGN